MKEECIVPYHMPPLPLPHTPLSVGRYVSPIALICVRCLRMVFVLSVLGLSLCSSVWWPRWARRHPFTRPLLCWRAASWPSVGARARVVLGPASCTAELPRDPPTMSCCCTFSSTGVTWARVQVVKVCVMHGPTRQGRGGCRKQGRGEVPTGGR